jgi:transposase
MKNDYYVGLDVHKQQWTVCVLDGRGNRIATRTWKGSWPKLYDQLARLRAQLLTAGQTWAICFEATCGIGWLYDQLRRISERVVPAHPRQIRPSKRKNDRIDAEKLAKLLLLDMVSGVWVPNSQTRAWRSLIQYRQRLLGERTACQNAIRALLQGAGLEAPRRLFSKKGRAWLGEQVWPTPLESVQMQMRLKDWTDGNAQIQQVTAELNRIGRQDPRVQLLQTIPGVGPRTAEAFVAHVDDAGRFSRTDKIGTYFGLVPCENSSAGKERLGHITKEGPGIVRWLLVEAAWQATRRSPSLKTRFERISQGDRKRKRIAVVALARHLACVMLAMLQSGEAWHEAA